MEVLSAMDLVRGKKANHTHMGTLIMPVQFLPRDQKDPQWCAWNLDWLEWQGLKQLRRNARRLMKNYKLAKGIIDKTDYIVEEDTEYADLIDVLTKEDDTALELKFYPIIPNVINTLVSEFAKRNTRVTFRTMDEYSYNEMLEAKKEEVGDVLLQDAEQKIMIKLQEQGMSLDSEEAKQALDPAQLKTLPEIQGFYTKNYRNIPEQWAEHQYNVDVERFHMEELEERAFRDMLITDREFWHYKMQEDDYDIELWNPVLTFYHKSPDVRYISQGNWVGKTEMLTVPDVIDKYGWIMREEQLKSLETIYPIKSAGYAIQGMQNDGSYYDATKSHAWNTNMPSLGYRQYTSMWDNVQGGGDIVNWIMNEQEDYQDMDSTYYLRVTTAYWKTQRRLAHLTKIDENGVVTQDIVDETHKITDKPIYDTTLFKNKKRENLLFGEHLEWIWINETYGGVKIGPNMPSFWGMPGNSSGVSPIYLGINRNTIGRLPFQFKGDTTLYGCKLPVEGSVFSDRNTRSTAMVDLMKPFQIGYNIVNNQIADILIDELGTVIMFDQNALPRHSMNEDWGKNNLAKAYVAMKNFQMLPLDTTISNTENPISNNHFQKLDLEQTNRLLSRINLATYFKTQAFEIIGITPQRLGGAVEQATATGIRVAVSNSFSQTETYFIQHCDYLMPRVHQMRTDLAQYYQSKKPSLRLQYITTAEDKVNFKINGTSLLLRDLNIFATTKANTREIVQKLKDLALESTSSGASIYDLGHIIKSETISEIDVVLKESDRKITEQKQQEQQAAQELQNQAIQAKVEENRLKQEFEASENEKDRQASILEAEIKAAGYGAMQDINKNEQSDYVDQLNIIQKSDAYSQQMNLNQQKLTIQQSNHQDKLQLDREKIIAQQNIADKNLQIARENTNASEIAAKRKFTLDRQKNNKKK